MTLGCLVRWRGHRGRSKGRSPSPALVYYQGYASRPLKVANQPRWTSPQCRSAHRFGTASTGAVEGKLPSLAGDKVMLKYPRQEKKEG